MKGPCEPAADVHYSLPASGTVGGRFWGQGHHEWGHVARGHAAWSDVPFAFRPFRPAATINSPPPTNFAGLKTEITDRFCHLGGQPFDPPSPETSARKNLPTPSVSVDETAAFRPPSPLWPERVRASVARSVPAAAQAAPSHPHRQGQRRGHRSSDDTGPCCPAAPAAAQPGAAVRATGQRRLQPGQHPATHTARVRASSAATRSAPGVDGR